MIEIYYLGWKEAGRRTLNPYKLWAKLRRKNVRLP